VCAGRVRLLCVRSLSVVAIAAFLVQNVWIATFRADEPKASDPSVNSSSVEPNQARSATPLLTPFRLLDAQGRPVAGAVVAEFFERDNDLESVFKPTDSAASNTSDERGEASLQLLSLRYLNVTGVFAIRQLKGRPLVGLQTVSYEDRGKQITINMYPACRVLLRIESTRLAALEKEFPVELTAPGWRRTAELRFQAPGQVLQPLRSSSTTGGLEFLLPPGRFTINASGSDVQSIEVPVEVKPDDRELFLGTIDPAPSDEARRGLFPGHRRVRRNADADGLDFVLRRVHHRSLRGNLVGVQDVTFSPDGKIVATAHAYSASPGDVKLWDWAKRELIATLSAGEARVETSAFSSDGRFLFGMADGPKAGTGIIVWDVTARRAERTLGRDAGRLVALAASPDGRILASSGTDETTRLWDFASGRETARIGDYGNCRRSVALASGGNILAIANGRSIKLWDVARNRLLATLESQAEPFTAGSIAFSPDGRTLAAAGGFYVGTRKTHEAQVRLYDVAGEPFRRRAILTFVRPEDGIANKVPPLCGDVVFTPDGRRVIAVALQNIKSWNATTAIEQDALKQPGSSGSTDRLAVSPDGNWLAITRPFGVDFVDIPTTP
jgi:WD domain, G-beta repeat/WD40-like Beta Propeller Repeat